jgi:hypothetical protein
MSIQPILEHVPEKWTRFSDTDMLPKFLNWREFFSIRCFHLIGKRARAGLLPRPRIGFLPADDLRIRGAVDALGGPPQLAGPAYAAAPAPMRRAADKE